MPPPSRPPTAFTAPERGLIRRELGSIWQLPSVADVLFLRSRQTGSLEAKDPAAARGPYLPDQQATPTSARSSKWTIGAMTPPRPTRLPVHRGVRRRRPPAAQRAAAAY